MVPRLPDVSLGSSKDEIGGVVNGFVTLNRFILDMAGSNFVVTIHERTVVAGVDHQCVVRDFGFVDRLQQLTNGPVDLDNEVTVVRPRKRG